MAEKGSAGQVDKAAAEDATAKAGVENAALSGAERNNPAGSVDAPADDSVNPYPNYDFMTLEALQSLADERGVEINRDVFKAHLITELRAADSGTPSAATRHGAR